MRKILTVLFAALFMVQLSIATFAAGETTIYIGQPYQFGAGSDPNLGSYGNSDENKRSSEQLAADAMNYQSNAQYESACSGLIDNLFGHSTDGFMTSADGLSYTFVAQRQLPTYSLWSVIDPSNSQGLSVLPYNSQGYGYGVTHKYKYQNSEPNIIGGNTQPGGISLLNAFTNWLPSLGFHLPSIPALTTWPQTHQNQIAKDGIFGLGAEQYRPAAGMQLIDFKNMEDRINGLRKFLSSYAEDVVNTRYIREIKIESAKTQALYRREPDPYGFGMTHLWRFQQVFEDGTIVAPDVTWGTDTITKSFLREGRFHVTATQRVRDVYRDVFTVTINEYWVIEDTGQIIYMRESTGGHLNNDSDTPIANRAANLHTYNTATIISTYSKNTFDWYINVIDPYGNLYEDIPSFRTIGFQTTRIK